MNKEKDYTITISIRLPISTLKKLEENAKQENQKTSTHAANIIKQHYQKEKNEEKT